MLRYFERPEYDDQVISIRCMPTGGKETDGCRPNSDFEGWAQLSR